MGFINTALKAIGRSVYPHERGRLMTFGCCAGKNRSRLPNSSRWLLLALWAVNNDHRLFTARCWMQKLPAKVYLNCWAVHRLTLSESGLIRAEGLDDNGNGLASKSLRIKTTSIALE